MTEVQKVREFHDKFNVSQSDVPSLVSPEIQNLRHRLMKEENDEYIQSAEDGDIVGIADAIGDMLYIAYGTACVHGLQDHISEVFNEIHRSNMSKLGPDGEPLYREDGKVLKGPGYTPPDINKILQK
jgi:predicted HAD superfamily Cof-like phosphohydrolase